MSAVYVPGADFSLLTQLRGLYRYCQTTKDPDVNFIDFITDHLININVILDQDLSRDNQKPHQPFQLHNLQHANTYLDAALQMNLSAPVFQLNNFKHVRNTNFHSSYITYIFHPPDAYQSSQAVL